MGIMIPSLSALLLLAPSGPQDFDPSLVPELATAFEVFTELADLDQDGQVTAAEVASLESWLAPMALERVLEFSTEIVFQGLNRDGLRVWTPADLAKSLAHLDVDGDGVILKGEPTLEVLCNGEMGTRGVLRRLTSELILEEGDQDADGAVSKEERARLVRVWGKQPNMTVAAEWIEAAKKRESGDRNRMAPGVAFLTLESQIDENRDGLYDIDRYWAWFKGRDANADGVLTRDERREQRVLDEGWRRPTAERMALPCLMPWQRNFEDALAIQKRTGQVLLIAANMDGETACDSLAAWQYRDAAFGDLASGYVCLVVSPDDHQPREYDDRGRRMVSPRLGRVTDREHIDLEPALYERYFEGRRVAPRHVGVDVDGTILFDVYLINDPKQLSAKLQEHARPVEALDWSAMDSSDLMKYADAEAREELERRMLDPDVAVRLATAVYGGADPDAGMIGLRDPEAAVREVAAMALASRGGSLDAVQMRRLLQGAAELGEEARASVVNGLTLAVDGDAYSMAALESLNEASRASSLGLVEDWRAAASLSSLTVVPETSRDEALAQLERLDGVLPAKGATAAQSLIRAQALLRVATGLLAQSEDPRDAAAEAIVFAGRGAAADPARAQAITAQAAAFGGEWTQTLRAARAALPSLWSATSDPAYIGALRALATSATQLAYGQLNANQPVPATLVADAYLAGRTLMAHPAATEADATLLLDLAGAVGDEMMMPTLLMEAIGRFPATAGLHQRLRGYWLQARGAASMEDAYIQLDDRIADPALAPTLMWFRGLALLIAAEWEVGQGNAPGAIEAYQSSLAAYDDSVGDEPAFEDSAFHYQVLAHAGVASLLMEAGLLKEAAEALQAAAVLRVSSLDLKDGLGLTPRERAAAILPALLPTLDEEHQAAFRRAFPE
ncbi:MAG: hypothetical protein ACI8WY_001581 [Planctomycetota bacterium]|jgi:hypothetical protein